MDDFLKKGFLGKAVADAIPSVRSRNLPWFELAEDLSDELQGIVVRASETVRGTTMDPKVLATALALRSCGGVQGAILMLHRGLVVEARLLVRSLIENAFCIAALLTNSSEFITRFEADDAGSRKGLGKAIINKEIATPGSVEAAQVEAALAALDKSAKTMSIPEIADLGPLKKQYLLYRVISNDAAHPSAASLRRHLNIKPDKSGWTGYVGGPGTAEETKATLADLVLAATGIGIGFTELLDDKAGNAAFAELIARYEQIKLGNQELKGCGR